jgi:riboflavin kinase/FMN adenylyltransferase
MAMAVLHSLGEWRSRFGTAGKGAVVTVGNFDGLHLGHQKILRGVLARAKDLGAIAAALTFDPHPLKVLRPAEAPPMISTLAQRLAGMADAGLEATLVLPFTLELSKIAPEEFVRTILVDGLATRVILVGQNFRFGHKHAGDVRLLEELGKEHGFEVEIIAPVVLQGKAISSSAIREAVTRGDVEIAGRLLGRPFALTGKIVRGAGRGVKLHFPTLNLAGEQELLPAQGVYATETLVEDKLYRSATNVGVRPTFNGKTLAIESHLFDFSKRVERGALEVRFWKRLRAEKKFGGPEELSAQIAKDVARTRSFFARLDKAHKVKHLTTRL